MSSKEHANSVVAITGGGSGIGRAAALSFAVTGARVAVLGRNTERLDGVVAEVGEAGLAVGCDVTDGAAVEAAFARVREALGPVDILVNNAGTAPSAPVARMDDETWNRALATNLDGTFFATRAVLPDMLSRRHGRIINVASVAGKIGFLYTASYCASKAAVIGLTRSLAMEYATEGITVNAVCPGWVDTAMATTAIVNIASKTRLNEEQARATLENMSPQKRMMTADEVAALILYLASDAAHGINGQAINVDGGEVHV